MRILSIDIGIKNLAYAVLDITEASLNILHWDTINLCETVYQCDTCQTNQNKKVCLAQYTKNGLYYCKRHTTKHPAYILPTFKVDKLEKQSIKTLTALLDLCTFKSPTKSAFISVKGNSYHACEGVEEKQEKQDKEEKQEKEEKPDKQEILSILRDYAAKHFFEPIEKVNANNVNLIDLGVSLKTNLDGLAAIKSDFDKIIIENQISPLAGRMKTIQGMITQYFIDRGNPRIEFISAANKLKLFHTKEKNAKKTSYGERKKMSVKFTRDFLNRYPVYIPFFETHTKKDDLADCLLQGLYYLATFHNLLI